MHWIQVHPACRGQFISELTIIIPPRSLNRDSDALHVQMYNDLVRAVDSQLVKAVVLLDLCSGFDTVDHFTLWTVHGSCFDIPESAMDCFVSDRTHTFYVVVVVDLLSRPLKMICNDLLVVKVNCWSYVFNIMKYTWILRNVKNKNIVEKNVWKCAPMIRKWWRHTRKTQPNSHYWVLSVDNRSRNNT